MIDHLTTRSFLTRSLHTSRLRVLLGLVMAMTAGACGGGGSGGGNPSGPSGTVATYIKVVSHTGTFALTLGGQTISTDGDFQFNLAPGLQQVTGQLTAGPPLPNASPGYLSFSLHGRQGSDSGQLGAPQRNSIQSTEGPNPLATNSGCGFEYAIFGGSATTSSPLKFSFTVKDSASGGGDQSVCR